tara:strand:- start:338 stop:466 length:129 start_codon:yes stop_codon:yes gene_type:complete
MATKKNARQAFITKTKDEQELKHRFSQDENRHKANQIFIKQE